MRNWEGGKTITRQSNLPEPPGRTWSRGRLPTKANGDASFGPKNPPQQKIITPLATAQNMPTHLHIGLPAKRREASWRRERASL